MRDCTRMLDGDGAFAHLYYAGAMGDQPAYDMDVFDAIRHRWVELVNERIKDSGKQSNR